MDTREIIITGLTNSNLEILPDTHIYFELVDGCSNPAGAFAGSGEYVAPVRGIATTNASGNGSITLPVTEGMSDPRYYLCTVDHPDCPEFKAPLFAGSGPVQWADFKAGEQTILPAVVDPFTRHMQNSGIHSTALGAAFLAHCSIDSVTGLPLWDGGPWPGSGGVTPEADSWLFDDGTRIMFDDNTPVRL